MGFNVSGPKTESQWITESVERIRGKEKWLDKKHPFDLKWTYWDAEDLRYSMIDERSEVMEIKRPDGLSILITSRLDWKHPDKLTLNPAQLIELFLMDPSHIDAILKVYREFGKIEVQGLTAPGLSEMAAFCRGMDKEIVDVAHALRKEKITKVFDKLMLEMEASTKAVDRVFKRIKYYRDVAYQYSMNKVTWADEMRRLDLLR